LFAFPGHPHFSIVWIELFVGSSSSTQVALEVLVQLFRMVERAIVGGGLSDAIVGTITRCPRS
jgi:hypothetical protein